MTTTAGTAADTRVRRDVYEAYLNRHQLVSGGQVYPMWTDDGGLSFADGAPDDTVIFRVDLATGEKSPLFDVAPVRAALAAATGRQPEGRGLPFDTFTPTRDGGVEFMYEDTAWRLDPATSAVEQAAGHAIARKWSRWLYVADIEQVDERPSRDGARFASVRAHNLVVRSALDGSERRVTSDGTPDDYWDIDAASDPWSPDGRTLLACRRDITDVPRVPRIWWMRPFEVGDTYPTRRADAPIERVRPAFVDAQSGHEVLVALDDIDDRYVYWLGWCPDGSEAFLVVYTRDFTRAEIFAADRGTGAVRSLLTEAASTAVRVQLEAWFGRNGFRLLADGSGFLWLSTRDGWNHLYLYDIHGTLLRQLTSGEWPVHEVVHISDGFVYFTASVDTARPYDIHVCRVPLEGGGVQQLTHETGRHAPSFAPNGSVFVDTHSTVDRPTRTDLVRPDGTPIAVLSEMDISRLEAVGYSAPEEFTVLAADGTTQLWGVLYKPFDFDPAQSYPVVEYIYGGPQSAAAPRTFAIGSGGYANLAWALAHLGYVTVCVDGRGTPGRSKAFQDVVHGNFTAGIVDHAAMIRQLCERHSWMDAERVGIFGASWGGYFTLAAVLLAADTYHAGACHEGGGQPWHSIYEPYLGRPQSNPDAYEAADLTRRAHTLRRPLLMTNGTSYITIGGVMRFTRRLIEAGIDHELVVVPDAGHGFVGVEDEYMLRKHIGFFERHVKHRAAEG